MYKLLFHTFFLLLAPVLVFAQELNYMHYDTKDGLAGSTVYDICLDKDGFLWFATENGLSRFDGTHFKNFTVKDGLPDNEVLKVLADSKGRVWILPFKNQLCYYFKGRIHTSSNDNLLKKITLVSHVFQIAEDNEQNIMFSDSEGIFLMNKFDSIKSILRLKNSLRWNNREIGITKNHFGKGFVIAILDSVFLYKNDSLVFSHHNTFYFNRKVINVYWDKDGNIYQVKLPDPFLNCEIYDNHTTYVNTANGCWAIDTTKRILTDHFLAGKKVSGVQEDNEKNFWFSTLGEGVYKLPSKETKTIRFKWKDNLANTEVFSLAKNKHHLVCGLGFSKTLLLSKSKKEKVLNFEKKTILSKNNIPTNRLYCSKVLSTGIAILGFDSYLVKLENDKPFFSPIYPIKSIEEVNKDFIVVGSAGFAFKLRIKDMQVIDTIWRQRCTKVFYYDGNYYIGTLNGLYEVKEDKRYKFLGDLHPALKRRITDIKAAPDGTLYIATNDAGVVVYKEGGIKAVISDASGMSSNICKTLFLDNQFLWIGTNKGINKIDLSKPAYPVLKYSSSDGLPSDIINAIYVEDSMVWVGTPSGLTYFNEKKISTASVCNLKLLSVTIAGKEQNISNSYQLPYTKNNIVGFEYVGISFKSGGDIVYHYKLQGLDKEWKTTDQTNLTYQSLPSGDYELQLYAINKFGVRSELIKVHFSIDTPFWETLWFYTLLFLVVVIVTGWLVDRRNKKNNKTLEEGNKRQQQFALLEQQALQAQMNPHFIFNCLNSIQQYILTNDQEKANQYLTGFASLIRQTLDNSGKRTITVSEEVKYLTNYLEMEEMRFGDNFIYTISVDQQIETESIEMPALLLQPYVENCLRHGIRYKKDGVGKVTISFSLIGDVMYCHIKDNGVGREYAAMVKSSQHIEYQSKGLSLTQKRIELLNKINKNQIVVEILDLKDDSGQATGTEVIVKIPYL